MCYNVTSEVIFLKKETKDTNILEAINKLAFIKYGKKDKEAKDKELETFKEEYKDKEVSAYDLAEAVVYMTQQYVDVQHQVDKKNTARYDVIVRALESNRILSKNNLKSIKEQLKTIDEEGIN